MKQVVEHARHDLHALQEGAGGVDGILFSNEFSLPYQCPVDPIAPAAMGRIIGELMSEITKPYGVDLESDPMAAIDLAAAVDAKFIRGTFTGAYAGDGGLNNTDIATTLRRKRELGLDDLRMLYFLNNESDEYLVERDVVDVAKSMIFCCKPDVLCISGAYAGQQANTDWITRVRTAANGTPVFCNTGCRADNIKEKLAISDGACVGTAFKVDGKFENLVDVNRVAEFMTQVQEYRKENE